VTAGTLLLVRDWFLKKTVGHYTNISLTANKPRMKALFFHEIWIFHIIGIGRTTRAISVRIFIIPTYLYKLICDGVSCYSVAAGFGGSKPERHSGWG
jgi:hypothetical protein